jgi:PAS domain S-box-containing protein
VTYVPAWIKLLRRKHIKSTLKFYVKYISPFVLVFLVLWLRATLNSHLQQSPYLLFTLAVFVQAWFGGLRSGWLTTILSTLAANYFLIEPLHSFQVTKQSDVILSTIFFLQAGFIATVTGKFSTALREVSSSNQRLARSQEKLRDTIDNIFSLIAITDIKGNITEANLTFARVSDQQWSGIIGKHISDIELWEYDPGVKARIDDAIKRVRPDQPIRYDERLKLADNTYMYVTLSIAGIDETDDGVMDYIIVSGVDITDRVEYEQDLEKVQSTYLKLINSNIIGMLISYTDGRIVEANDAFLRLIGYSRADYMQAVMNWQDITPPEYAEQDLRSIKELMQNGYAGPAEKELWHKDGICNDQWSIN